MDIELKIRVGGTYRQAGTGTLLTCDLEHEGWEGTEFRFLLTTKDGRHRFWYSESGKGLTSGYLCEEVTPPETMEITVVKQGDLVFPRDFLPESKSGPTHVSAFLPSQKLGKTAVMNTLMSAAAANGTRILSYKTPSLCPDCAT